jgi:hypothetical protein
VNKFRSNSGSTSYWFPVSKPCRASSLHFTSLSFSSSTLLVSTCLVTCKSSLGKSGRVAGRTFWYCAVRFEVVVMPNTSICVKQKKQCIKWAFGCLLIIGTSYGIDETHLASLSFVYSFLTMLFQWLRPCSVESSDDTWMMNWKRCGRTRPWPNLRYYFSICIEGLKESRKNLSGYPGQDLNPGPPRYL